MKQVFFCVMLFFLCSCNRRDTKLGIEGAREELKRALADSNKSSFAGNIISNQNTAIEIAEPILFKTYGKDQIISERPYEVYQINNYWILNGTLPNGSLGGTFLIILSAKNGDIIKLIHGK